MRSPASCATLRRCGRSQGRSPAAMATGRGRSPPSCSRGRFLVGEVLYYAIPFFVLLLIAEYASFRHLNDDDDLVGYDLKDTGTSITMGLGNVVINVGWKLVVVAVYAALYELTPLRLDPHNPLV